MWRVSFLSVASVPFEACGRRRLLAALQRGWLAAACVLCLPALQAGEPSRSPPAAPTLGHVAPTPLPVAGEALTSGTLSGVLQVTLALAVVVLAIVATAWLMRRLGAGQLGRPGQIRLVGGVAVGPKERVVIVEVRDTWLVLGVTPAEISALHQLPRPLDAEPPSGVDSPFSRRLAERVAAHLRSARAQPSSEATG